MKNALIIAVHPDDETLGAAGYLLRLKDEGYNVTWLIVTGMKEVYGWEKDRIESRNIEIQKVSEKYKFDNVIQMEMKPAGLDEYSGSELVSSFSSIFNNIKPEIIILPNRSDAHSDHKIAFDAAISCTKKFRYPFIKMVLTMEILSETDFGYPLDFVPNYFVDISDYMDKKIEIMKVYESELKDHPFPRSEDSLKALATLRGSQAGTKFAEAFNCIKCIY